MSVFTQKIDSILKEKSIGAITVDFNNRILDRNDLIYPNQVDCAIRLLKSFDNSYYPRCNYKIVRGLTQAGKTGVLKATVMFIKTYDLAKVLNLKRVYYITGDNGKDMTGKNAKVIDNCFTDDFGCEFIALKNSDLRKDLKYEHIENALIFLDEGHYGVENAKNKVNQWLKSKDLSLQNKEEEDLIGRSVYIVSNSATNFTEEASDLARCKEVIKLYVNEWDGKFGYVGVKQYFENGSFVEGITRDSIRTACVEIREHLEQIYEKTGKKKAVIARIYGKTFDRVKSLLEEYFIVKTFFQDANGVNYDGIENTLVFGTQDNLSDKPIMIVIKGAYTMGNVIKPIPKKYIGAVYDVKSNCTGKNERKGIVSTIQGLPGRITGYWNTDDWKDIRIWIHEGARVKMSGYFYEQSLSTPIYNTTTVFIPSETGSVIGILPETAFRYEDVPEFKKGTVKEDVLAYLKDKDKLYDDMLPAFGRRYTKKGHQSVPYFSTDNDTADIRVDDNIGKACYTFLYDESEHTIDVLCGRVLRGEYHTSEDNKNAIVETLRTS